MRQCQALVERFRAGNIDIPYPIHEVPPAAKRRAVARGAGASPYIIVSPADTMVTSIRRGHEVTERR